MRKVHLIRMVSTIAIAVLLAVVVVLSHPEWFTDKSTYILPTNGLTPKPRDNPTAAPRASATPATPRIGMTQHVDDIWVTPRHVDHSQGEHGIVPNIGDEFLIIHLKIVNRSQVDFPVQLSDFKVLDSNGQIDPPMQQDFTRSRLREVQLIPGGHTEGTLVFETPLGDSAAVLMYQPDTLDPLKRKLWLTR
jgi:Domain of unknown function (DUF4352)